MTHLRFHRSLLWPLLAAALLMRALLPQGYMPERSDSGQIAVVLCASGGTHLIPLKQGGEAPGKDQRAEPPCVFAGLAGPALPPPPASELLAPRPVATAYSGDSASESAPLAHRLLPPARGPPLAA